MAWSLKSFVQNITDILLANAPPRIVMGQDPVADPAAFNPQVVDEYGRSYTVPAVAASGAAPAAEHGTVAALLEPKTWEYDTGLDCTFTPGRNGLAVVVSDTGAESVTYTPSPLGTGGGGITVTVDGGVSTDVSLAATWAASDAADVCDVTIASGTFPVGASLAPTDLWTDRVVTVAADVRLGDNGERMIARCDNDGMSYVLPRLPRTPGAVPTDVQGTPGRLQVDETFSIAAGKYITVHPLQAGVSWVMATAGAAAVSAVGKVVTLTSKNDDTTTVTAMRALIAASASVAALISIPTGTGADTFDHTYVQAETPLWTTGTIPANAMVGLGPDGYYWPMEIGQHDSPAGTQGTRLIGTAYADPAGLPADVSADGDDARVATDRKGVQFIRPSQQEPGDSESMPQKQVQFRGLWGTAMAASGQSIPLATVGVLLNIMCAITTAGTFNLRDGAAGGAVLWTGTFAIGTYAIPCYGKITNGLYVEFIGGGALVGTVTPIYAPDV
jgi:hypothetical protein